MGRYRKKQQKIARMDVISEIRRLPDEVISRIKAGEVIESPASCVKELVENSIDAGAKEIEIRIKGGGKSLISVRDDGIGMGKEDIEMSVGVHTTSKLRTSEDIWNIATMGFRGEALSSMCAVSRMRIVSSRVGASEGYEVIFNNGKKEKEGVVAWEGGSLIELRELFVSVPARLKFLSMDKAETQKVIAVFRQLSLASLGIGFSLFIDDKEYHSSRGSERGLVSSSSKLEDIRFRAGALIDRQFAESLIEIESEEDYFYVYGLLVPSTLNYANRNKQLLYVNSRVVSDKVLYSAIAAGYGDSLVHGRQPGYIIYLSCEPSMVDCNVSPRKTEIRFREPRKVHNFLMTAVREGIRQSAGFASTTHLTPKFSQDKKDSGGVIPRDVSHTRDRALSSSRASQGQRAYKGSVVDGEGGRHGVINIPRQQTHKQGSYNLHKPLAERIGEDEKKTTELVASSTNILGEVIGQIDDTYIIAYSKEGLVLVDQHAAHERIVYETLKSRHKKDVIRKQLLTPYRLELSREGIDILLKEKDNLERLGLEIEIDEDSREVSVKSYAEILGSDVDIKLMLEEISSTELYQDIGTSIESRIDKICSKLACYGSIRAGKGLSLEEMDKLLRQMESTEGSAQCNHGRPSYVVIPISHIESLFARR